MGNELNDKFTIAVENRDTGTVRALLESNKVRSKTINECLKFAVNNQWNEMAKLLLESNKVGVETINECLKVAVQRNNIEVKALQGDAASPAHSPESPRDKLLNLLEMNLSRQKTSSTFDLSSVPVCHISSQFSNNPINDRRIQSHCQSYIKSKEQLTDKSSNEAKDFTGMPRGVPERI